MASAKSKHSSTFGALNFHSETNSGRIKKSIKYKSVAFTIVLLFTYTTHTTLRNIYNFLRIALAITIACRLSGGKGSNEHPVLIRRTFLYVCGEVFVLLLWVLLSVCQIDHIVIVNHYLQHSPTFTYLTTLFLGSQG